ncbi:hypothetical protein CICLE_v10023705mg, partial [Citrus x clementina]
TLPFPLFSQFSVFIHSTSPPSSSSSNQRMCTNNTHLLPAYASKSKHRSKPKVQIYGLTRRRCEAEEGRDMQLKNIKLYLENQSIIEENEKLRKQANLLHQENLALMSEFRKKFSH